MLEDSPFLALPESLDEALTAVSERPSARVMGGGTDLMQELSWRHYEPSGFVSLQHVSSLAGAEQVDGTLTIGAMTRIVDLEHGLAAELAPGLRTRRPASGLHRSETRARPVHGPLSQETRWYDVDAHKVTDSSDPGLHG